MTCYRGSFRTYFSGSAAIVGLVRTIEEVAATVRKADPAAADARVCRRVPSAWRIVRFLASA
jgi:hypothetical protein